MEQASPQISKSPFKAKNFLNLQLLCKFNENLADSKIILLLGVTHIQNFAGVRGSKYK